MKTEPKCAADGAWERLHSLEDNARLRIMPKLEAFRRAYEVTYEAAVIVPILRKPDHSGIDVRPAGMFFKRALNDLRGAWLLIEAGYASQAASVTASLYENAFATICLTASEKNVATFMKAPNGELPWSPMEMVKMVIKDEISNKETKDYENGWRSLYAQYVWLCQCKHPTRMALTLARADLP